jgi:predicted ATPase/DNA-binding SARP family transcriptional activator
MTPTPPLSIRLLGGFQVTLAGQPVTAFETDKTRALLAYLAVQAAWPQRRETLAGLLWPGVLESSARRSLSQALFKLREAIGDYAARPPFLLIAREALQFNPESNYWLDVSEFERRLNAGQLAEAVELYTGDFLQQFFIADSAPFEEWALAQREALQQRALQALSALADVGLRDADFARAETVARRQLALDPWREAAHQQLMLSLALGGQRNAALAQYEICRRALWEELAVEPSAATRRLYEQIKSGEIGEKPETPLAEPAFFLLPSTLTPFLGRERELAEITRLLTRPECRLLTLVGPGGMGKTRLSVEAARHLRPHFPGGTAFISLAPLTAAAQIAPAVAEAVGLRTPGAAERQLAGFFEGKQILLVLDNLEHLVGDPASLKLVEVALNRAPGLKLLVTSREPLAVADEWILEIGGLGRAAAELFTLSARRARADFAPADADRAAIAQICALVGEMPLGLELAAAWVRTLTPAEIAREIQRGLDVLATTRRDVPERHRSLRAVFDYSWRLLSATEQRALRELAVFQGGFTRQAAEAVAGASLSTLAALQAKSLLARMESGRYDIHPLLRQYLAVHSYAEAAADSASRERHLAYYLALAEQAEPQLLTADQVVWLERLEVELANLRAALRWSLLEAPDERGARLCAALWRFWSARAHLAEGRWWLEAALQVTEGVAALTRAKLLLGAGQLAILQSDFETAERYDAELGQLRARLGPSREAGLALLLSALLAQERKAYTHAQSLYEAAQAWFRQIQDDYGLARALQNAAVLLQVLGQDVAAEALFRECLGFARRLGHQDLLASVLMDLGWLLPARNPQAAQEFCREALGVYRALGNRVGVAVCLEGLAGVAAHSGWPEQAARLFGASLALREALQAPLTGYVHARAWQLIEPARAHLGAEVFERTLAEGHTLTYDQALAEAERASEPRVLPHT